MQLRIRQLISLLALATSVSAGACKQSNPPADAPSSRSIGGGADQAGLAEAIITLLFIARKQARDSGECAQGEQRTERRSGEDRALKQLHCDPLARQDAKRASSEQNLQLKSVASQPDR